MEYCEVWEGLPLVEAWSAGHYCAEVREDYRVRHKCESCVDPAELYSTDKPHDAARLAQMAPPCSSLPHCLVARGPALRSVRLIGMHFLRREAP